MDLPETALMIEKLNEEFDELQKENDNLKQEIVLLKIIWIILLWEKIL